MNKKSIASIELAALVNELQFLVKGKVSQIYHQEKKEVLLQLHAPGKGKQLLKLFPGKFLCLSNEKKESPANPSGFCMQLRKYVSNAFIKDVYQKDSERIVIFELEKKDKYYLILEFFSKGNLILTDDKFEIIATLEWQRWKDRIIKPKEKYEFPKLGVNWKKITEKELTSIINNSEKSNISTSLATEVGFGGLYAEEICKVSEVSKSKKPAEIGSKEVKAIFKTIKRILKDIETPSGFIYSEQITPFALSDIEVVKQTETYNQAINTLKPIKKTSPYDQKIKTMEKMIEKQQESMNKQEKSIDLNTKKGELIYEKYQPLQKMFDIISSMKEGKEWTDIAKELKKEKNIKQVNLKDKKINVNL
jgi:predicted ribosome quality control (RQC) complex YloA/Tae2 family protein